MISAVAWVPRGAAKAVPNKAEPSPEELAALQQGPPPDDDDNEELETDEEDADEEASSMEAHSSDEEGGAADASDAASRARQAASALAGSGSAGKSGSKGAGGDGGTTAGIEAALRELDMDHYDDDDTSASVLQRALNGRLDIHKGKDEYITLDEEGDVDSEIEDLTIQPTDLLILAARNEDDVSNLEVWVYEEADEVGGEANVYVHHELVLPAFPLCLAWLNCHPSQAQPAGAAAASSSNTGNLVAIGTMEPGIEIWDLDTIDAVEPVTTLGGEDKAAMSAALSEAQQAAAEDGKVDRKKKKKLKDKAKKKGPMYVPGSHTAAVLGLSWNITYRNVLASGSADATVKVWDVVAGNAVHTLSHHSDKVQSVCWNPAEPQVLLTGGYDKVAALVDARSPDAPNPPRWSLTADVEACCWCPHDPTTFLVSTEDGLVVALDARKGAGSAPLWQLHAHERPTCALSWCPGAGGRGLLATGSTDKAVKLWDVSNGGSTGPVPLASQDLQVGAVFTLGFCTDAPYLLAVGGAGGSVSVWDVRATQAVAACFPGLLPPAAAAPAATA